MAAPVGCFPRLQQFLQTGDGIKYCILKPTSLFIDSAKEAGYDVSGRWTTINSGFKEVRNVMGFSQIPDKINRIANSAQTFVAAPTIATGANCLFTSLEIASPVYDLATWWSHRIAPVARSTLDSLLRISAVALFILSVKKIVEDIAALYAAIMAGAMAGIPRTILDLGKRVTLVASASLTLVGIIFATPIASSYLLACTAGDIAFTIAHEFA